MVARINNLFYPSTNLKRFQPCKQIPTIDTADYFVSAVNKTDGASDFLCHNIIICVERSDFIFKSHQTHLITIHVYLFKYTVDPSFTVMNYTNHFRWSDMSHVATTWQKTTARRYLVAANYRPISLLPILFKSTSSQTRRSVAGA